MKRYTHLVRIDTHKIYISILGKSCGEYSFLFRVRNAVHRDTMGSAIYNAIDRRIKFPILEHLRAEFK